MKQFDYFFRGLLKEKSLGENYNESEYFANIACTGKTSDFTHLAMLLQNVRNSFYKFGSLNLDLWIWFTEIKCALVVSMKIYGSELQDASLYAFSYDFF